MSAVLDARKLQVLLEVLQRAPASLAEQLVCEEIAALLVQLAKGETEKNSSASPASSETSRVM
jgi:hypothetical protein